MKYSAMFHHFHGDKHPKSVGGGSVSAFDFNVIIDYLEENYNLITPDEFTQKVVSKSIKQSDICLSFDDSLKCQFDIAYPELEKRKLKAFYFVYSGAFSENPPFLEFFRDFRFNFFSNIDHYYDSFFEVIRIKYVKEYNAFLKNYKANYLSNYSFYSIKDKKYRFLRDIVLKDKYFEVVLDMMREKDYSISIRKKSLFQSTADIKILHDKGHTIGLHSHSHPTRIDRLSYKDQFQDYTKNYEFINSITNKKITSMAHPLGNYSNDTLKVLKKLGILVGFRDSLTPPNIKSALEIPREDHTNILNTIRKNENNSLYK
jgi:peptidoglycan/xylan/chitin deacetylase (PgdA/CDA1 family)